MATYAIALAGAASRSPAEVVTGLPPTEIGEVVFYPGGLWQVDAIEAATAREADGRLLVSRTTDAPTPGEA
jgi:hypothetical protein